MLHELGIQKGVNLGGWFSQCDYSEDRLNNFITEDGQYFLLADGKLLFVKEENT